MDGFGIGLLVFGCLSTSALFCLFLHPRLPPSQREEKTHNVIKLAIGMIVVMTSLVLGLLTASVKGTYDGIDRNVHLLSTQLILLDRALRLYGAEADETRARLGDYVERALKGTWPAAGDPAVVEDPEAGKMLDQVELNLKRIKPADPQHAQLWSAALERLTKVVETRWTLIDQTQGTLSVPLLVVLVSWLALIFASFGYNAPRNAVVVVTLLLCITSIAAAFYLLVDMDTPFTGIIQISPAPIQHALDLIRR